MRPRLSRTLFSFVLFTALFGGACATAVVPMKLGAQDRPPEQPGANQDMRPDGDDALFAPLPVEGLFDGKPAQGACKAVLVEVPFEDTWEDDPLALLPADSRVAATGLRMQLEQRLDYLPGVYQYLPQIDPDEYLGRVRRHQATLRFAGLPTPGQAIEPGTQLAALDATCRRFGADVVFCTSFARPSEADTTARALCLRYENGKGVRAAATVTLAKPDKKALTTALAQAADTLCAGLAMHTVDGTSHPQPAAPVPPLAADDAALRMLVQMRALMMQGELTQAWVKYEDLKRRDVSNGRAALLAMEIFRGFAENQTEPAERDRYLAMVLNTGREGLKGAPNDVILRGRLCRLASIWFKRDAWCLDGLKQALRVQPSNPHLLDWHVTIEHALARDKQAQWLEKHAVPVLGNGLGEYLVATACYGGGDFANAVTWYRKAMAKAPFEHEYAFSLGLVATYLGERLQKAEPAAEATTDAFATAAEALVAAQRIDPTMLGWPYEFHVRAATRSFKRLPVNPDDLERLMLSQAIVNGLQPTSKTAEWDKLVEPVIKTQRRLLREAAAAATAGSPDYEIWLMARLQFALVDTDREVIVQTLRTMRRLGHRSNMYLAMAGQFAAAMDAPDKKPG